MFKKYVRNIIVHWITISGVILIAAGTFLACIGQNRGNRYDDKQLHQDIRKKAYQIGKLLISKNKLLVRINKYQKSLSGKDKIIQQLEAQVGKLNITTPKQLSDEKKDASHQVIRETEYSDKIAQARSLCREGKYDEAYKIADNLRQKYPDFGLAYFVLGTIEMRRKRYKKGEDLLNRAIQLGIPDEDAVWAFYNLRISSLQKQDFEKARDFFEKAVKLNANMEESKKPLRFLDDLHSTISSEANIDLRK